MRLIGETARGYCIYVEENEVGGHRYWSNEFGGIIVWDTSLVDMDALHFVIAHEILRQLKEAKDESNN